MDTDPTPSEAQVQAESEAEERQNAKERGDLIPVCGLCRRERTLDDAYDYNPIQVVTGRPLGWYSGDDGEVCPECMTKTLRGQA